MGVAAGGFAAASSARARRRAPVPCPPPPPLLALWRSAPWAPSTPCPDRPGRPRRRQSPGPRASSARHRDRPLRRFFSRAGGFGSENRSRYDSRRALSAEASREDVDVHAAQKGGNSASRYAIFRADRKAVWRAKKDGKKLACWPSGYVLGRFRVPSIASIAVCYFNERNVFDQSIRFRSYESERKAKLVTNLTHMAAE